MYLSKRPVLNVLASVPQLPYGFTMRNHGRRNLGRKLKSSAKSIDKVHNSTERNDQNFR